MKMEELEAEDKDATDMVARIVRPDGDTTASSRGMKVEELEVEDKDAKEVVEAGRGGWDEVVSHLGAEAKVCFCYAL